MLFAFVNSVQRWRENGSTRNGYILNFCLDIARSHVSAPSEYSKSRADQITSDYLRKSECEYSEEDYPNVIVVMNEAFADFTSYGNNYEASQDVWEYYHSIDKNAIRGLALTSIFGGGTANSEYEFLTGNTMAFLPYGAVPYMQYTNNNTWSLVSYFNELGYETIGAHPYIPSGWNRNNVYPQLGFNEIYFQKDFPKNNLIRDYVTDSELYQWILERLEYGQNRKFIFAVSMQNHSPYAQPGWEYYADDVIDLSKMNYSYEDVCDYLSLQKISDNALRELVEALKETDSKTVLVVFGDHQPQLNDSFYNELLAGDSLETQQQKYKVPFLVWANYDVEIDKEFIPLTSLNYLAEYIFEVGSIPKPEYYQFLSKVRKVVPAMNQNGYYLEEDGTCFGFSVNSSQEPDLLKEYRILEYNSAFDTKKSDIFIKKDIVN